MWLLADLADAAGRVLEDDWFVFVNLQREPRFRAMRPESVYSLVRCLRRVLGDVVPNEFTPHWFRHYVDGWVMWPPGLVPLLGLARVAVPAT